MGPCVFFFCHVGLDAEVGCEGHETLASCLQGLPKQEEELVSKGVQLVDHACALVAQAYWWCNQNLDTARQGAAVLCKFLP